MPEVSDNPTSGSQSPRWSSNTKLVVALTFVAILAGLCINFYTYIGPVLVAFVLSYLAYPVVNRLWLWLKIPWWLATLLIYLLGVFIILGLLAWGGITVVQQVQSLIGFLQNAIKDLPTYLSQLSHEVYTIGPFKINFQLLDLPTLANELLGVVQPLFSQMGAIVGGLATGAFTGIGWLLFIILVSFFIVSETAGVPGQLINFKIPGYAEDTKRLGIELARIWNAFLRNQLVIMVIAILIYTFVLGILQVRFFFGLAIMAGFARFIPYVGPAVEWTIFGLVTYFQGYTIFGFSPFGYVLLILGVAILIDNIVDSVVMPRLMADALKVHPAAVMVAVLMGASILGLIGVLLAAPVMASAKLMADYAFKKLLDQDPWENPKSPPNLKKGFNWVSQVKRGMSVFQSKK
jgi:predicted PurR-regulated permease PerM